MHNPDNLRFVAVDFETEYDKDFGIEMGQYNYTHHPRFNAFLISVYDGKTSICCHPKEFDWSFLSGAILLSANAAFDKAVYLRLVELGIAPSGLGEVWHCTANLTAWYCNRRSLAKAAEYLLHKKPDKSLRTAFKGLTEADIRAKGIWEQTVEYARADSILCWEIWDLIGHHWPEVERRLSALTVEQSFRGIAVDIPMLERDLAAMVTTRFNLMKRIPWIEAGYAPTSPKALCEKCREVGIPCPPAKVDDEDAALAWEQEYAGKYEWASAVGELRSLNKLIKTYETIKLRLRPDGRMDGNLLYYGAHTGRWSGSGKLNLQNLRSSPLIVLPEEGRVLPTRQDGAVEIHTRHLFIPAPGKKFLVADFSQIEARIINWVVGNTAFLDAVSKGTHPYVAYAKQAYGWTGGNELKKVNPDLYKRAKISVLQLGYQSGWVKLQSAAAQDGILFTDEEAQATVKLFRESNPGIVALWHQLDTQSKRSLGDMMIIELPNGARLKYGDIKRQVKTVEVDPKTKELVTKVEYTADIGEKRMRIFGGVLTNNLCQAIARHVLGEAMLRVEDAGLKILWSIHDEVVVETDLDTKPDLLYKLLKQVPSWLEGCPLDAEVAEMTFYSK